MTCFRSCLKAAKIQEYSGNSAFADVVVVFVVVVVGAAVAVVLVLDDLAVTQRVVPLPLKQIW